MPKKIRELKAMLAKAGFAHRSGKGSHTFWWFPAKPSVSVTVSGNDGDDARDYLEPKVKRAIRDSKGKQ
jgi:predicted RNA binding protein YcfA (HicA-like mRNA interferase family)